jgi:uncharacterized protein YcaQ
MGKVYPLRAIRRLALETQGLTASAEHTPPATPQSIQRTIAALGAVQIDTLNVVARSHYLAVWSRHGAYDPRILDRLVYDPEHRILFEGWQHAACLIPLEEWRYQMPLQRSVREGTGRWYPGWIENKQHAEMATLIGERIRQEGALRVSDFERGDHRGGPWFDWRPAKSALEYLFTRGDLMIANRVNFQRVYDLTERVRPAWVDTSEPTRVERNRFWLERAGRALGASLERNPIDYAWMQFGPHGPILKQLLKEQVLVKIQARLADGEVHSLIVHPDNLPLLEKAADGEIKTERTTFLSPFDSFFWAQGRDEAFWGFRQRLEAYTPAPKRIYGYFSLAILHRDRLVGRLDPKMERGTGLLRLKSLHLEPGIAPGPRLVADVAGALRDFMVFHGASNLAIENSNPAEFGTKLMKAI